MSQRNLGAAFDHWLTTPPIEEGDPDEDQCPLCGRWVDYHDLDDGPCAKCEPAAGAAANVESEGSEAPDSATTGVVPGKTPDCTSSSWPEAGRECEGCGQQKPIGEMSTVCLSGTGDTFQCEQGRGVFGTPGCAAGTGCES